VAQMLSRWSVEMTLRGDYYARRRGSQGPGPRPDDSAACAPPQYQCPPLPPSLSLALAAPAPFHYPQDSLLRKTGPLPPRCEFLPRLFPARGARCARPPSSSWDSLSGSDRSCHLSRSRHFSRAPAPSPAECPARSVPRARALALPTHGGGPKSCCVGFRV
jgi:hypothetical protein